jgi:hypothetical protein
MHAYLHSAGLSSPHRFNNVTGMCVMQEQDLFGKSERKCADAQRSVFFSGLEENSVQSGDPPQPETQKSTHNTTDAPRNDFAHWVLSMLHFDIMAHSLEHLM